MPLLYTFYYATSATVQKPLNPSSEQLTLSTTLVEGWNGGSMDLFVRATDNLGAYSQSSTSVTVTRPVYTVAETETAVTDALSTMASLQAA